MRDHDECEEAMRKARVAGRYGYLEWLATRCDRAHGHLSTPAGTDRVAPVRTAIAARTETKEAL